jgi:LPS-assembly lipoprotein
MTRAPLLALMLIGACLSLGGCGLRPLYSNGSHGVVAQTLAGVQVAPIEGKAGWLMANALRQRLAHPDGGDARYQLNVKLDDKITGLGIRADDSVSRERRSLRARFQLIDLSNGAVVLDATAGSDAGVDVVGSEYATIAAEDSALENLSETVADQIVSRVALYARRTATP